MPKEKRKTRSNVVHKALDFASRAIKTIKQEACLDDYKIKILYRKDFQEENENLMTVARVSISEEYLRATIIFGPDFIDLFVNKEYEELFSALCHEISHIEIDRIYRMAIDRYSTEKQINSEVERLTEKHSRMLKKILDFKNTPYYATTRIKKRNRPSK